MGVTELPRWTCVSGRPVTLRSGVPAVKFTDAVKSVLNQYATFSGRARRSEFWFFVLFGAILSVVAAIFDRALGSDLGGGTGIFGLVVILGLLVPRLAVTWRRLHDTDRSGAWALLALIPLVGLIVLIVWACQDSTPAPNRFGNSPKGLLNAGGYSQAPTGGPTWS